MMRYRWFISWLIVVCFSSGCGWFGGKKAPEPQPAAAYPAPTRSWIPWGEDKPVNVILLIGDGMGQNHIALARHRQYGTDGRLAMEKLPVSGWVRTHSFGGQITDSAAAATAMACGVKTHNGKIGISADGKPMQSLFLLARARGWRMGLVATSSISHATPAGFAATVESRGDETEIAWQLFQNRVDVLFGGGRQFWLPAPAGKRQDGRDLIAYARRVGYQVITVGKDLSGLRPAPAIGLFADDGLTGAADEPTLAEMTAAAIRLLSAKPADWFAPPARFVLMVEGSQIDWACHKNDTDWMIRELLAFDAAVAEAMRFAAADKKTLVIVTSDHETGGLVLKTADNGMVEPVWQSTQHTAADVPLFAFGPGANRFAGVMDNTDIPKRLAELLEIRNFPAAKTQKAELQVAR